MGCQQSKKHTQKLPLSTNNFNIMDIPSINCERLNINYINNVQRRMRRQKWFSLKIPYLKLQENKLYRRRMDQKF